ncbi:MAG TPA: hypothetical protein VKU83_09365, partial [Puia sp.]|nr:hypothetical protein [Puia sp.]
TADYQTAHDSDLKERFIQAKMQQLSQTHQAGPDAQQQAVSTANALISALRSDRQSIYGGDLLRTIVLMALAAAVLGLYIRGKIKPVILLAGLIVLTGYDLLTVSNRYLSEDNYTEASEIETAISPTPADQQIRNDPDKNFRVFDQSSQSPFEDSRASYFHNSIGGYSPAKLGLYQDLIDNQLLKGNMQVYDMLNTKYFIGRDPKTGQSVAQQNPGAFGPTWLVKGIRFVANGDQEMKALDSVDLRDTVVIQQRYSSMVKTAPVADSTAHIRLQENLNDKITYRSSARTPQFAVFSEIYYPEGWDAYIDGVKVEYLRVDYLLRGLSVPAGDHTIEFRFEPRSFAKADAIAFSSSLAVCLLLLTAGVVEWRRNRPKRSNPA